VSGIFDDPLQDFLDPVVLGVSDERGQDTLRDLAAVAEAGDFQDELYEFRAGSHVTLLSVLSVAAGFSFLNAAF
jgi:hypothetical protein